VSSQELINHTEPTHTDYDHLRLAFQKIEEVVTSVDAQNQIEEDMELVAEMLHQIKGTKKFGVQLMVPGRKFVIKGDIHIAPKDHTCKQKLHYFLFSDLLILAEDIPEVEDPKKKKKNKRKRVTATAMIPFSMSLLSDVPDDEAHRLANMVELIYKTNITTLVFETKTQKEEWIANYLNSIERMDSFKPHGDTQAEGVVKLSGSFISRKGGGHSSNSPILERTEMKSEQRAASYETLTPPRAGESRISPRKRTPPIVPPKPRSPRSSPNFKIQGGSYVNGMQTTQGVHATK